jgi:tetratricopeptide (TPR) repeat protein
VRQPRNWRSSYPQNWRNCGYFIPALTELRVALTFDPISTFLRTLFAQTLVFTGEPDAAIAELDRVFDLDPHYLVAKFVVAFAFEVKGLYQEAINVLEPLRAELEDNPNYAGFLGYAYARLGNRVRAKGILQDLKERFSGDWIPGCDIALIYTGLNDKKSALHWLERAGRQRSFDAMLLRVDPRFNVLHGDRDFEALMKQFGI